MSEMMNGTNGYEWIRMDTNGKYVPMADAPRDDSEASRDRFFFQKVLGLLLKDVESLVTL